MMKICATYHTVDQPWGGANNFLRALYAELLECPDVKFEETPAPDTDIIFMNQLGAGPARGSMQYKISDILRFKKAAPRAKLVVRVVNLKNHAYPLPYWKYILSGHAQHDSKTLKLMNMADHIIFQSHYQHSFFYKNGFKGKNYTIIHNGASRDFSLEYPPPEFSESIPLRVLATLFSKRQGKRHNAIAALSACPMTEVLCAGHWPEDIDQKNVKCLGVLRHDQLREVLKTVHYIIHPSERDPCPNALIEGLNMGVPALYNDGPGSGAELAKNYGLPWDDGDLAGMTLRARENYQSLRNKLAEDRNEFGIKRAAAQYHSVFQTIMDSVHGQ